MEEQAPEVKAIGIALERHLASARLACATELAHARHYKEAEELLRSNGRNVTSPVELDLLARMAGKQGRLDDARLAWEKAASSSPDNEALKHSLALLNGYARSARERRQLVYGLVIRPWSRYSSSRP